MNTKFAVAGVLLALAGPVCGAHWKPVSVTPERSMYIDMDALVRKGDTVQAWDWQKFGTGQTSATWQGTYFWVKSLTNYHCTQRDTDAVLKVYFGNDGVEIKRVYLEGLQFPAAVEPDSLREKMLEMACNPPKPAPKRIATATKPDTVAKSAEPAAAVSSGKPAKADEKGGAAAQAQSAGPVVPPAKPAQILKPAGRPPYVRTARMMSRIKSAASLHLAKAKPQADLKCPPPAQAAASDLSQSLASPPQLTDAGSDGMFN
jgi:hypothetical protein